eukprot:5449994-Prymnesium_polylepis.1
MSPPPPPPSRRNITTLGPSQVFGKREKRCVVAARQPAAAAVGLGMGAAGGGGRPGAAQTRAASSRPTIHPPAAGLAGA